MKLIFLVFIANLFIFGCSHSPRRIDPQIISLKKDSPLLKYSKIFNNQVESIPDFSVYQYHPGLKDLFAKDGISNLCMPAVLSTFLIQKFVQDENYRNLSLSGMDKSKMEVDANAIIRQLLPCLKYSPETGTNTRKSANCLSELGKQNNIKMDIKIISAPGATTELLPGIQQIDKLPDLTDLKNYIDQGYKIIAGVDFFYETSKGDLRSDAGHYVAIHGYASRKKWSQDFLHVYITDPTFKFWKSMPKAHLALLTKNPNFKLPNWTTKIDIKSPTLGSLKNEVFLTELLIFK